MNVSIVAINGVIRRFEIKSARYFNKDELPSVVTISRVCPNVRAPIIVSVATLLLVASHEDQFSAVLSELSALGRAPEPKDAAVVAATCHDFETEGLGATKVPTSVVAKEGTSQQDPGPGASDAAAALAGDSDEDWAAWEYDEGPGAAQLDDQYVEMEELLAQEMASEVVANRVDRVAVCRLVRPASGTEQARTLQNDGIMADEPPLGGCIVTQTARPDLKFSTPSASDILPGLPTPAAKSRRLERERLPGASVTGALSLLHLCRPRRPLARVAPV